MSVISFVKDRAKEVIAKPAQRTWNLGTIPFRKKQIAQTPHEVVFRENGLPAIIRPAASVKKNELFGVILSALR